MTAPAAQRRAAIRRRAVRGVLLALPLAAPAALWLACLWAAERKLAEQVEAIRTRGEPVAITDVGVSPPLAERENAAVLMRAAETAARITPAQDTLSTDLLNDAAGAAQIPALRQLVAANRPTLDLSRKARHVGGIDWSFLHTAYVGPATASPAAAAAPPACYSWRTQMLLLYGAAWLAHRDGDDATFVELLRDLLFVERAMADYPLMNSHVWAGFVVHGVVKLVESSGPELRIADAGNAASSTSAPAAGGRATRAQVRALMDELLDDSHLRRAYVNQMRWERTYWLDHTRQLSDANPLYRPVIRRDAVRVVEVYERTLAAVEQPDWPAARAMLGPYNPRPAPRTAFGGQYALEQFARPISDTFAAAYSGPTQARQVQAEQMFYGIAMKRMAAVAVAAALYRADHGGALPPTLDALRPAYLPQLPRDPYAPEAPVGYLPASVPPALYCVGLDGVADAAARPPAWTQFFGRYGKLDVVLYLGPPPGVKAMVPAAGTGAPAPATRPASPQAGEEDSDPADEPGDGEQPQAGEQQPPDRQ